MMTLPRTAAFQGPHAAKSDLEGVFKPLEDVAISEGTIVEVRVPSYAGRLKDRSRSVRGFAFCGMWKGRTDIGDSVDYIGNLRRDLRG